MVTKNRGSLAACIGRFDGFDKVLPVENIVTQHEGGGGVSNELRADVEGLRKPLRTRLRCVAQRNTELAAITQQSLEER